MNGIETAFIARTGTEPEMKTSQAGKSWTAFNACVGEGEEAQWIRIAAFGATAERLAGHLPKGSKVYVEGILRLEEWTDREGNKRTGLKVAAWKVEPLAQIGRNKAAKPKAPPEGEHSAPPSARDWQKPLGDDAIPFAPEWR